MANRIYRVYLIGYKPPGWDMRAIKPNAMQDMMEPCDVCFTVDGNESWRVGQIITPDKHFSGPGDGALKLGTAYRCIEHEHDGKVVLVTEVTDGN